MGQLLGLVALGIGLVLYSIQRRRRMQQIVAEGEHEAPVATCTVPGAQQIYDEVRFLRIAFGAGGSGPQRHVSVHAGNGGIGVSVSDRAPRVDRTDEREHAQRLLAALKSLDPAASEVLRARGVEDDLMALAEQASGQLSDEARTAGAAVLQRAEQALTTPQ